MRCGPGERPSGVLPGPSNSVESARAERCHAASAALLPRRHSRRRNACARLLGRRVNARSACWNQQPTSHACWGARARFRRPEQARAALAVVEDSAADCRLAPGPGWSRESVCLVAAGRAQPRRLTAPAACKRGRSSWNSSCRPGCAPSLLSVYALSVTRTDAPRASGLCGESTVTAHASRRDILRPPRRRASSATRLRTAHTAACACNTSSRPWPARAQVAAACSRVLCL